MKPGSVSLNASPGLTARPVNSVVPRCGVQGALGENVSLTHLSVSASSANTQSSEPGAEAALSRGSSHSDYSPAPASPPRTCTPQGRRLDMRPLSAARHLELAAAAAAEAHTRSAKAGKSSQVVSCDPPFPGRKAQDADSTNPRYALTTRISGTARRLGDSAAGTHSHQHERCSSLSLNRSYRAVLALGRRLLAPSLAAALFILGVYLTPALAQDTANLSGTTVTLRPTEHIGGSAEVLFENRSNNGPQDNSTFSLTHDGLTASVTFTWNAVGGSDEIVVEAPEGFVAIPPSLLLPEDTFGVVVIYPLERVGM